MEFLNLGFGSGVVGMWKWIEEKSSRNEEIKDVVGEITKNVDMCDGAEEYTEPDADYINWQEIKQMTTKRKDSR